MHERARRTRELRPKHALQERVATAILDAAARTFAGRGESANMDDVAREAGVARATVYRYFPNKPRLRAALARVAAEDAETRLLAARIDEVAVEEGVSRVVRAFVEVGDSFIVLAAERGRAGGADFERRIAPILRELLDRGRAAGRIREDIPVPWLADALVGAVVGVLRHGSLGPDDTVSAVTALFLHGARAGRRTAR